MYPDQSCYQGETDLHTQLNDIILGFVPVGLSETTQKAALLDRSDSKYVMSANQLEEALDTCRSRYRILEINGSRSFQYDTVYFDTPDLRFYHEHHAGKQDRRKVRIRKYLNSGTSYLEVKHRHNKGNTVKSRKILDVHTSEDISVLADPAFSAAGTLPVEQLHAVISISYERITLVDLLHAERVTIDRHIVFQRENEIRSMGSIIIAEIKQHRKKPSFFRQQMRKMNIREGSVSKYCMGTLLLNAHVKRNRFKRALNRILKISEANNQTPTHA